MALALRSASAAGSCSRHPNTPAQQCSRLVVRAAKTAAPADTSQAAKVVKQAVAKANSVPAPAVLSAMLDLEAAKLPVDGWQEVLQAPGTHWRLVFTSDEKDVKAAMKQQPNKGGIYFPIAAVQKFDATKMDFENGVFLGPIAYLTFNGPYAMSGRQLTFDVSTMNIGLGPLKFSIPLKKDAKSIADMDPADRKKLPFFLYSYIDDDTVVGRGRGGGLAVWTRADKEWEARAGVLQVYK